MSDNPNKQITKDNVWHATHISEPQPINLAIDLVGSDFQAMVYDALGKFNPNLFKFIVGQPATLLHVTLNQRPIPVANLKSVIDELAALCNQFPPMKLPIASIEVRKHPKKAEYSIWIMYDTEALRELHEAAAAILRKHAQGEAYTKHAQRRASIEMEIGDEAAEISKVKMGDLHRITLYGDTNSGYPDEFRVGYEAHSTICKIVGDDPDTAEAVRQALENQLEGASLEVHNLGVFLGQEAGGLCNIRIATHPLVGIYET